MDRALPAPRFVALRHRDFRLLWLGEMVSTVGSQMQLFAVNWQVYRLLSGTRETLDIFGRHVTLDAGAFALGMLGLVRVLPIIAFALLSGMLADTLDRRRMILWSQAAALLSAAMLALLSLSGHISLVALYGLTATDAAAFAFSEPPMQALVPLLVPRVHLTNAVSLNTLIWQLGTITGPALAGVIAAHFPLGIVYAVNAASFAAVILAVAALRYRGTLIGPRGEMSWAALRDGLRFTYRAQLIWSSMLLDFGATFFSSARTMLPIVADRILGVGVQGYGVLATAQPLGAVLAGTIMAWRKDMRRQGAALLLGVLVYGLATCLFGLSTVFMLSYVLFGLTGAGDTVSTVIRATIRQAQTPDALRGRMTSVHMILAYGGPQLGEVEAGVVAAALGAPFSIVSGGLATVLLTLWVAWRWPMLRAYDSHEMMYRS